MTVHTKGNYGSTPVSDEGGCCNTHEQANMWITATKQMKPTGEVSLFPDSAASLRQEFQTESGWIDETLAANCLERGRFRQEGAWHEHDNEDCHERFAP